MITRVIGRLEPKDTFEILCRLKHDDHSITWLSNKTGIERRRLNDFINGKKPMAMDMIELIRLFVPFGKDNKCDIIK